MRSVLRFVVVWVLTLSAVGCMHDPRFDWDPSVKRLALDHGAFTIPNQYGFVGFEQLSDEQFAGAQPLLEKHGVRRLQLRGTEVGDASIDGLLKLRKLEWLDVSGTWITGDGVQTLATLPQLTMLVVTPDQIDPDSLAEIARRSPRVEVVMDRMLASPRRDPESERMR